ncbi:hypothetical protein U1Q18_024801, partial [Sarracenia purpurea var. burkii]
MANHGRESEQGMQNRGRGDRDETGARVTQKVIHEGGEADGNGTGEGGGARVFSIYVLTDGMTIGFGF